MITTALLLAAPALADQAAPGLAEAPCGYWVATRLPEVDARFVPVDIAPAFMIEGCGDLSEQVLITVTSADGIVAYRETVTVLAGTNPVVDLPQLDLEANTLYTLQVEGSMLFDGWSFETGDGVVGIEATLPTVSLIELTGWEDPSGFTFQAYGQVTPTNRIVRLDFDNGDVNGAPYGDYWHQGETDDDLVCVTPHLRADDGSWIAGAETCEIIEVVEPPREARSGPRDWIGCSSSGGLGMLLGPLPLLLLRRRR